LQKAEFKERAAKGPAELRTAIDESYRYLLFPSRDQGRIATRDLGKGGGGPTGGGSGGLHLEDAILNLLAGTALSQSKTQVIRLNNAAQLPDKARFQLALGPTPVGAMVDSRALFAALNNRLRFDSSAEVRLTIGEPDPNCKFLSLLTQLEG
jgi:hypothetical protein